MTISKLIEKLLPFRGNTANGSRPGSIPGGGFGTDHAEWYYMNHLEKPLTVWPGSTPGGRFPANAETKYRRARK